LVLLFIAYNMILRILIVCVCPYEPLVNRIKTNVKTVCPLFDSFERVLSEAPEHRRTTRSSLEINGYHYQLLRFFIFLNKLRCL